MAASAMPESRSPTPSSSCRGLPIEPRADESSCTPIQRFVQAHHHTTIATSRARAKEYEQDKGKDRDKDKEKEKGKEKEKEKPRDAEPIQFVVHTEGPERERKLASHTSVHASYSFEGALGLSNKRSTPEGK